MTSNPFDALTLGQHITGTFTFSAEAILAGAAAIGETAYVHVDREAAAGSMLGGLIAAGGHSAGVMIAVVSSYFGGKSLGMELTTRFVGAIHSGETIAIDWEITGLEPKPRWQGGTVTLEGSAMNEHGDVVLTARATILVSPLI